MRTFNTSLFNVAPITMVLFSVNVVLFIVAGYRSHDYSHFSTSVLLDLGALQRELIWEGEWARLGMPIFLHGGFLHLLMNNLYLYQRGPGAELYFGSSNYGTIYLLSGIIGCCFSSIFGHNVSVGASGALFGLMTSECVVRVFQSPVLKYAWRRAEVREAFIWLGLYFMLGVSGAMGNIDNWGHLGGIVGGALVSTFFELWRTRRRLGLSLMLVTFLLIGGTISLTRWSVYSPAYHIHQAWLAEEAHDKKEKVAHLKKAREWAKFWGKAYAIESIISAHEFGFDLNLETARSHGYYRMENYIKSLPIQLPQTDLDLLLEETNPSQKDAIKNALEKKQAPDKDIF